MTAALIPENGSMSLFPSPTTSGLQQTTVLHDGGDVTLEVGKIGSFQQRIKASKSAMGLASPVWKAMFSHVWAESEAAEISLPDDDADATLLVLQIAHLRFQDLPKKGTIPLHDLVNLAVICDKYDLTHLVRPFLDLNNWARERFLDLTGGVCHPDLLFVAWTFGYSESFEHLARRVLDQTTVTSSGTPLYLGQRFPEHMPPGLLDNMLDLRTETITSVLHVCYSNLDQVLNGRLCKQTPRSEVDCRCMIFGSFVSFLISKKLYPQQKQAADVSSSVQELSDMFGNFNLRTYVSHDYKTIADRARSTRNSTRSSFVGVENGLTEHKTCGEVVNISTRAKQICAQIPSPVLEEHRIHMAAQAKK